MKSQVETLHPINVDELDNCHLSLNDVEIIIQRLKKDYGGRSILRTGGENMNVSFELLPEKIPNKPKPIEKRKEITFEELKRLEFSHSKDLPDVINDAGIRKRWVGIGWVEEGQAGSSDEVKLIRSDVPSKPKKTTKQKKII